MAPDISVLAEFSRRPSTWINSNGASVRLAIHAALWQTLWFVIMTRSPSDRSVASLHGSSACASNVSGAVNLLLRSMRKTHPRRPEARYLIQMLNTEMSMSLSSPLSAVLPISAARFAPPDGLDPEIWVMTPGRGDVFGFVMNRRQGFFFPWAQPRTSKSKPKPALRLDTLSLPRPQRPAPSLLKGRMDSQLEAPRPVPIGSETPIRPWAATLAGLQTPESHPVWWRPAGLDLHARESAHSERVADSPAPADASVLATSAQRLQRLLAHRGTYVVPVTLHPDLELEHLSAQAEWERLEPHIERVQQPHDLMAWDRHYRGS